MNNPTLGLCCEAMIGRADIEESKSNVAMNAWLPQASYPCGNFSDTSSIKLLSTKGSIGLDFSVCISTENLNQASFSPFGLHEISVLIELTLGHLCYRLTDVPPQPNSPPENVSRVDRPFKKELKSRNKGRKGLIQHNEISKLTPGVVVFHRRLASPTYSTPPKSIHRV